MKLWKIEVIGLIVIGGVGHIGFLLLFPADTYERALAIVAMYLCQLFLGLEVARKHQEEEGD